jgi:hypothetical protein
MKLSGHLTLEIVDELTGEIVNKIEQDNIITDLAYSDINVVNSCYWPARGIFISTETATPVRSKTTIQCSGIAYQGAGQPPIQAFHNASPPYFVITQRLDAVTTARTFQTVGLTTSGGGQVININVTPYAYLLLNTPCTQEANQIVNLTYRITVQNTALIGTSTVKYPRWVNDVCYSLVYSQGIQDYSPYLYNMVANAPLPEYNWRYLYITDRFPQLTMEQTGTNGGRANATSIGSAQNTNFYRYKQYWDFYRTNASGRQGANGRVVNGILSGNNIQLKTAAVEPDPGLTRSAHSSMQLETTSNLQSAFAYSSTPPIDRGPMFLPDNNPAGTGLISFSEDPWTGIWPTIYRIKITTSGNVGTAKYVLGVKHFGGYTSDSNFTYATQAGRAFHPYIYSVVQPYIGCHGWQFTMPILGYSDVLTVQADNTGISIINQFTGQHYDLDGTTTPALPITNFRQMAIDRPNNLIYVACASTGLWKIDISNLSSIVVTNEIATPAYAVDVSAAGVVYTFLNMATTVLTLTSSASSYVTDLGFAGTALTTSNRIYIHVNKLHADTRIAVVIRNGSPSAGLRSAIIYWWSLAAGDAGAYTTNIPYCGESQCSFAWCTNSDNRFWSGEGGLFSFGSATMINAAVGKAVPYTVSNLPSYDPETFRLLDGTIVTPGQYANMNVAQDIWGNYITFNTTGTLYKPSTGAIMSTYNNTNDTYQMKRVTLTNGVILSDGVTYFSSTNGMDNSLSAWVWYKWDGTNWIKAVNYNPNTDVYTDTTSTDTKTTTTGYLPLLDGINVRFENGATGTSFLVNEVYDQYVCKGILKTNDIYLYIENSPFYTQPVYEKVTITPTVITLGNNYGVVVDGAPGNTSLSPATSAVTVNPLWHSILPEYTNSIMRITIDGTPVTKCFSETVSTIPSQASLNAGEIIVYRNGLILCSTADATKTLAGYFSYVAKSD